MKKHNYKFVDPYLVGFHPVFLAEDWVKSKEKLTLRDVDNFQSLKFAKDALFWCLQLLIPITEIQGWK